MAYTFTEIEKRKTNFIFVLGIAVIILYFITALIGWLMLKFWYFSEMHDKLPDNFVFLSFKESLIVLWVAILFGGVHLAFSMHNLLKRILGILGAIPLNPQDHCHRKFQNIIEEVCVAVGGANIKGCVFGKAGLNAFSITDYSGQSYIGITEGLLAKLNRSQLEAVVAHQAGHIVSGDSLLITFASSIFGIYGSSIEKEKEKLYFGDQKHTYSTVYAKESVFKTSSGFGLQSLLLGGGLLITAPLNALIMSLVSQQIKFRADAVAVRLSRNPLALAEALYIISKSWRGEGTVCEGLSGLFIVEPKKQHFSGMLSHPPIEERIDILLDMAHTDQVSLETILKKMKPYLKIRRKSSAKQLKILKEIGDKKTWFVFKDNQWQGPFLLENLMHFSWFNPYLLVRRHGAIKVKKAYEDADLARLCKPASEKLTKKDTCPYCYHGLEKDNCEGIEVHKCAVCKGVLAKRHNIETILIREEQTFSNDIIAQADIAINEKKQRFKQIQQIKTPFVVSCPRCEKKMRRRLFSHYAPVEVDVCTWCDIIWFDRDELDIIQVLYDRHPHKGSAIG